MSAIQPPTVNTVSGGGGTGSTYEVGSIQPVTATAVVPPTDANPPATAPLLPPTPGFLNIENDFNAAVNTTQFAYQHAGIADQYIQQLGVLAAALVPPVISPVFPSNLTAPAISAPVAPSVLPIVYTAPATPAPFNGALVVNTTFPAFTATPPPLIFPNAPVPQFGVEPSAPGVDLNFTYPTVDVTLPTPPHLLSISVVPFNGVTFPVFSATSPVLTLAQPQIVNYVSGSPYTDNLLSGLTATLQARLAIGITGTNTGLPAAVEQNIWNRAREREYRQLADSIAGLDLMEKMGYAFPPGAYITARIKLETDLGYTTAGLSRDVAIKQAELEQTNIKNAMDVAATIESKLIDYANQTEQRRFDACKYATDAGVAIYNAGVQAYTARVGAYRAAVDVYTAQIAGARAQVEIYTAQIEAEKLKVDANSAIVQDYKVMVDAALASIEVFKGEIQLVQTQAEVEKLKVDIFAAEIQAYVAQINIYTSQIEAYRTQISAEQTKEQIYATQAQVYGTLVDATYKGITANIDVYRAQLAAKTEEYDAYKALVESQAENVKAIAAANSSTADIYRATVQGTSSYNEVLVKEWEATMQIAEQVTQIGVQAAQANGQLYLTAKSVATDAAKVGAQVEAQIAASALGAVTFATHRSRQDSSSFGVSSNYSNNRSSGTNTNIAYSNSASTSVSGSISTNAQLSVANSTSTVTQIQTVE